MALSWGSTMAFQGRRSDLDGLGRPSYKEIAFEAIGLETRPTSKPSCYGHGCELGILLAFLYTVPHVYFTSSRQAARHLEKRSGNCHSWLLVAGAFPTLGSLSKTGQVTGPLVIPNGCKMLNQYRQARREPQSSLQRVTANVKHKNLPDKQSSPIIAQGFHAFHATTHP